VVIAIAPDIEDRVRIAELIDGNATVLLVSEAQEAVEFLRRAWAQVTPAPIEPTAALPVEPAAALPVEPAAALPVVGDELDVDADWRTATWQGRQVALSPLEYDLLRCLLAEVGHIRSFESVQQLVWHNEHQGGRAHVQSVVKRLRRKLASIGSPFHIDAVRGVGLRLVDLREARPATPMPGPRRGDTPSQPPTSANGSA
jgi:DNA-binding response OmpR family regulator